MKNTRRTLFVVLGLLLFALATGGQSSPDAQVVQAWLTEPGSTPFSLQAVITERGDPSEHIDIKMSWLGPDKWKRTIKSDEFSQTLMVSGEKVFEEDSADYMPLAIQVLTRRWSIPVRLWRPCGRAITS